MAAAAATALKWRRSTLRNINRLQLLPAANPTHQRIGCSTSSSSSSFVWPPRPAARRASQTERAGGRASFLHRLFAFSGHLLTFEPTTSYKLCWLHLRSFCSKIANHYCTRLAGQLLSCCRLLSLVSAAN